MPKLFPIRAIRYAGDGDLSTKIAPPYDVLDEGPKQELLARDSHNIVAIDLPVTPPKTVGPDEAYERAGATFRQWLAHGVMKRDAQPAIFAYEQVYAGDSGNVSRRGFIAALGLEEFNRSGGGIFRHEHTIKSGTDDRLKLMQATAAQLSPVFGVFDDSSAAIRELFEGYFTRPPDVRGTTTHDGVDHRLWVVRDEPLIDRLQRIFDTTDVFIADGHHRYTTALNYWRQMSEAAAAATCLFALVPLQDDGLKVLPTHRVLCGVRDFEFEGLARALQDSRFALSPTKFGPAQMRELASELGRFGHHAVGLWHSSRPHCYILSAEDPDPLASILPGRPQVWRTLDVAVFHELLVDRILRPHFGGARISYKYPHLLDELVRLCGESDDRLGVIMQPTPLRSVCDVARAGEVMPPKSTFFYPKLATGLVINPLE